MTERQKGWVALGVILAVWCTPTLFVKYLLPYYDPFAQNFLRYASSTAVMLPLMVWLLRKEGGTGRKGKRRWLVFVLPALVNALYQTAWVTSQLWLEPAFTSFLNKSSVLFAAGMAYAVFPEERPLFRSRHFRAGVVLCVVGTVGLSLLRSDLGVMKINTAVLLALFSAALWAAYSVMVKKVMPESSSTVSFAIVSVISTAALAVPALGWSNLGGWHRAPWQVNVVLVLSGMLCIGLGHTLYYYALKALGVSVCATLLLLTPLGTLAMSRWLFGEQMTAGQIVSGVVLLAGGALTVWAKERPASLAVAGAAEAADA
jgi:drug/metabolite transporter (DMT)-like permease